MPRRELNIRIDKLTNSIEDAVTDERYGTDVLPVTKVDIKKLKKKDWLFDWNIEFKDTSKGVYKLVVRGDNVIQGLMSVEDRGHHIFMHLIESAIFNKGKAKRFRGVAGNLVAFACELSFKKGYDGFVSFESKTSLIKHYQQTLNAQRLYKNVMSIDTAAAKVLIAQYFGNENRNLDK